MVIGGFSFAANRIRNADVASNAAIAFSKLEALTSGNILVGNGSNVATSVTMSGDATLSNTGALTIANSAVTDAKFRDSVSHSVVGRASGSTGVVADIQSGSNHDILRRNGGTIGFGSIDLSQSAAVGTSILALGNGGTSKALTAANGGIVYSDADSMEILAAGTAGQVLQSNGAAAPSWATAPSAFGTWTSYTPTFGGMGTMATVSMYYRTVGTDTYEIQGFFTLSGNSSASTAFFTLPNSETTAARYTNSVPVCTVLQNGNAAQSFYAIADNANDANLYLTFQSSSSNAFTRANGSSFINSGASLSVNCLVSYQ